MFKRKPKKWSLSRARWDLGPREGGWWVHGAWNETGIGAKRGRIFREINPNLRVGGSREGYCIFNGGVWDRGGDTIITN